MLHHIVQHAYSAKNRRLPRGIGTVNRKHGTHSRIGTFPHLYEREQWVISITVRSLSLSKVKL